jgi:nicotinate-nucleotide adenylyltransferase
VLEVQRALRLDQVRLIPLAVAVHRAAPVATAGQRLAMLHAAVAGQPEFMVDDREVRRTGPSFTFDTLAELRQELPHATLCLLIGYDAFRHFLSWHRPLEILGLAHVVVMQRPESPLADPSALAHLRAQRQCKNPQALRDIQAGYIIFQSVTQLDISSSALRTELAAGGDGRFLLPDAVREIIVRERLYGGVDKEKLL